MQKVHIYKNEIKEMNDNLEVKVIENNEYYEKVNEKIKKSFEFLEKKIREEKENMLALASNI